MNRLCLKLAILAIAALGLSLASPEISHAKPSVTKAEGVRLAKNKAKAPKRRYLKQEKTFKTKRKPGASTNLDFESTAIGGEHKTPMGTLIGQTKSDKNFDFVKIRTDWHPEMMQSATVLDSSTR